VPGKGFVGLRDEALIRLYASTGARLSEVGDLLVADVDLNTAGVPDLHAHRWRHSFAHEWKLAGADTGDLMLLLGWVSEEMPRRYGASAAAERAMATQQRIGIGERV
jgi:integrase